MPNDEPWRRIDEAGAIVIDMVELARCLHDGKVPHKDPGDQLMWSEYARMIARCYIDAVNDRDHLDVQSKRLVAALAETIKIARTFNVPGMPGAPMLFEQLNRFERMLGPQQPLTIEVNGPGMAELRAAFEAAPDGGEIPFGIAFVAQALLNATRVVLGLDPPGIYEGPGIPELRLVLDTMPPSLPEDGNAPDWLVRLHQAARVVLGRPVVG